MVFMYVEAHKPQKPLPINFNTIFFRTGLHNFFSFDRRTFLTCDEGSILKKPFQHAVIPSNEQHLSKFMTPFSDTRTIITCTYII